MLFVCGSTSAWQLTIAVDKCCVLHIGKVDKTPTVYSINNVALPAVRRTYSLVVI